MAHINLLPWRETLRKQKKQEYLIIVGVFAVAAGLVWGGMHVYMGMLIDNQNSRNDTLKQEIKIVEKKIEEIKNIEKEKENLIERMKVIEQLQSNRPTIVHMFDELAKIVPEGLYIETITQKGSTITIKGKAQSNARVSAFMHSLEDSDWFQKPALVEIVSKGNKGVRTDRDFNLVVLQEIPVEDNGENK